MTSQNKAIFIYLTSPWPGITYQWLIVTQSIFVDNVCFSYNNCKTRIIDDKFILKSVSSAVCWTCRIVDIKSTFYVGLGDLIKLSQIYQHCISLSQQNLATHSSNNFMRSSNPTSHKIMHSSLNHHSIQFNWMQWVDFKLRDKVSYSSWLYKCIWKKNQRVILNNAVNLWMIIWHLYCALNMLCKIKGAGHCTSAKRMTSIWRHVAEAFPPARQGTIL